MARSFLPDADAALLAWSTNFSALISATPTAYGLTAPQATAYAAKHAAYAAAYQAAVDPVTRTKGKVAAKNDARFYLKAAARLLAQVVGGQATVTNEQRIDLGLTVRVLPAPIPAPALSPDLDVVSVTGRTVRIRLHDAAASTRRGRPPGVQGAAVFSHVGAAPPPDIAGWKFEGNTTRTVIDIPFPDTVAPGAVVWLTAFWFNPRALSGPACDPVSTNIQFGGVSVAA